LTKVKLGPILRKLPDGSWKLEPESGSGEILLPDGGDR
jgi:hypothetical protein